MSKITLTPAMTAREVLDLVDARKCTKAQAIAYLQARVDAYVAAGKKPKWATRAALAKLRGLEAPEALPEGLATRKGAKAPAKAEPKAPKATKAKAAPKARKAPAKDAPEAANDPMTVAANALASLPHDQFAAFLANVLAKRG